MKVGVVGYRGMVGSVLMERLIAENDFADFEPVFFSTSQVGAPGPDVHGHSAPLLDALDLQALSALSVIVSTQGGDYTQKVYPKLRQMGWNGYWIDAASTLRMNDDAVIVLDPINRDRIDEAMGKGLRTFVGGNCTVSLMLLALHGLVKLDAIEWISSMNYQAASGAGAQHMRELLQQMGVIHGAADALLADSASSILEIDRAVSHALKAKDCPVEHFGLPLAGNLIPWIDSDLGTGQSKEEWKGMAEANKMLQRATPLPIDGLCVRVGAMRCHSQALTIKLKRALPLREVEGILAAANPWVKVVANTKEETLKALTPVAVSGRMEIPIGRLRTLPMGDEYLAAFTLGDQLLWGAAEPVRRMLKIVLGKL